uniref:E2 ubiquitin-conjugating enzyme n=1 Tax=Noccaea caerulescens TaxID=107243 RepID=A0A1J3I314_NOCCA
MEPNVVEIATPLASCSRTLTPNKGGNQELIDLEQYELQNGGVHDSKNKGKGIQFDSLFNDEGSASDCYDSTNNGESNSLLDPDSLIYEDDDEYNDQYGYDMEDDDDDDDGDAPDEYSMYQDIFDAKDIPTGVEVSMDWFPDKETAESDGNTATCKKTTKPSCLFKNTAAAPVAQPWKALPHNSGGVIPNSAYSLPQNSQALASTTVSTWKHSSSSVVQPQTPDTVMGEAPASSGLLLPVPKKLSVSKSYPHLAVPRVDQVISAPDTSRAKRNMEDFLGSYLFFKRFDIVEDFSDHHYASKGDTSKQHSKEWAKRIQEEWRILENDLPEMIFVRAYESRMDLLRAVIIGAAGTPYHDGLFFFDIFFPDAYPSVPPNVYYHSGGLRINPNLYNCGKVCLSLLGTWSGTGKEKWMANNSTMLQVLVSIQALILNEKPYFNEPGYERTAGSAQGEAQSKHYSENTFLLSLKTMVYTMRRPPKYFENFAYGHFYSCAHDFLKACDAYRNGAPVGSKVKVKVKEGDEDVKVKEGGEVVVEERSASCSPKFRKDVTNFVETLLLNEFILLGVKGLEPEEEDNPSETNNIVAESSSSSGKISGSKRDRVSSN